MLKQENLYATKEFIKALKDQTQAPDAMKKAETLLPEFGAIRDKTVDFNILEMTNCLVFLCAYELGKYGLDEDERNFIPFSLAYMICEFMNSDRFQDQVREGEIEEANKTIQ